MAQAGFNNLLWFMGIVEDRRDPRKMGRIKVRCFDIHPDNKQDVPTDDLPWAIPILGNFSTEYKPPLEGSWVFGFFLDGRDAQHPMVLGIIPGMPTTLPDPDNAYSGSDVFPKPTDLYQPDIPRLSRGENIEETNVARRYNNREEVPGYGWEEPSVPYNTTYPYNKVTQTESGHVMEFDDTPGSERINIEHRTGTFTEIAPNGSKTNKIVGDNYTIVEMNDKILIKGNADVVIYGVSKVNIEGNCELEVDGSMSTTVHGNYDLNVAGNITMNSGQAFFQKSSAIRQEAYLTSINHYAKVNYHVEAKNNVTLHANTGILWTYSKSDTRMQTDANFGVYAKSNLYTKVDGSTHHVTSGNFYTLTTGQTNIKSTGNVAVEGALIHMNTDGEAQSGSTHSSVPYGSNPSLRTFLGDPAIFKFASVVNKSPDGYTIFTDPISLDEDTHTLDIEEI